MPQELDNSLMAGCRTGRDETSGLEKTEGGGGRRGQGAYIFGHRVFPHVLVKISRVGGCEVQPFPLPTAFLSSCVNRRG